MEREGDGEWEGGRGGEEAVEEGAPAVLVLPIGPTL